MEARARAEAALRQSERDYRGLFENAHDAIIIFDPEQEQVLEVNPRACEIYGFSRDEFLGLSLERISQDIDRGKDHIRSTLQGSPLHQFETTQYRKDGTPIRLEINASEVEYRGRPAILSLNRDVTQKTLLEAKLRQSQKMEAIGTLAGGIAHDFNNMLSAIIGNLELGMMDLPPDQELRENLDQALRAAFRAAELVRQILSFSRHGESAPQPVRLAPVIRETLQLLRVSLPAGVECRLQLENEESIVLADPIQINQVVMNLCSNAIHAMHAKGGLLHVEARETTLPREHPDLLPEMPPGRYAMIRVSDTGHGMGPEIQERIFEPFFTTKPAGEGTGLGLSVVYGIVRKWGGMIAVDSRPGVGSTFRILLPLAGRSVSETDMPPDPIPLGRGRILLVDDEANLVRIGERLLRRLGYEVTAVADSNRALELFLEAPDRFDLVVTDQAMPGRTGLDLAADLLSIRPELPVILCTGFSHAATPEQVRELGIRELLMKPLNFKLLAQAVARSLPAPEA